MHADPTPRTPTREGLCYHGTSVHLNPCRLLSACAGDIPYGEVAPR